MEPLAPLPPHERGWRHPSEIGDQAWRQSEPPIAIGRGLAAATGVFGGLLALALLMTLLPTHPGREAAATVRSSIGFLTPDTSAASDGFAEPADTSTPTTLSPTDTDLLAPLDPRIEALRNTMPTYQLRGGPDTAVAVVVTSSAGRLVLTTAAAVRSDLTVELATSSGDTVVASVLFVDQRSGLALLEPSAARVARSASPFRVAASVAPGDVLTFFGDRSVALEVNDDGTVSNRWELDRSLHDGSPVVNQRGELVALCSFHDGAHHLIGLASLGAIEQALAAYRASSQVWLGVSVTDDESTVRVEAVDGAGPAATAGVVVGDAIVAFDGASVHEVGDLMALLCLHEPLDQIVLTLRSTDGRERQVTVVLASPHSSI